MRRALPALVGVVIVVGGLFLLLTIFSDRDSAPLDTTAKQGPGVFEEEPGTPPTSGPTTGPLPVAETDVLDPAIVKALSVGDVVLVYGSRKPPPELVQLRNDVAGPFDAELAAGGLMAILVRREGVQGIEALAWQHRLTVESAGDPALEEFINHWLGQTPDLGE